MSRIQLPDHPAFLRLSKADRGRILDSAEIWDGNVGCILYHPADSGEDLLLLLSGRLEYSDRRAGEKRWMAGELWGEDRLVYPEPVSRSLVACEDSRWLRWPRQTLISLAATSPSIRKGLSPVRDKNGVLLSGLSEDLAGGISKAGTGRTLRSSLRPATGGLILAVAGAGAIAVAGSAMENLPHAAPLLAPALYLGWLLVFLFVRMLTEYSINADAITSRSFDWGRFAVESRHVPVDRIQGVEAERNGIFRRLLGYGTVFVKTSALEGELQIRDVKTPEVLAREISALHDSGNRRVEGRSRESMRRTLEESGFSDRAPRLSRPALSRTGGQKGVETELRFRKSLIVLYAKLVLPLLVFLVPLLVADAASVMLNIPANLVRLTALIPLFWFWYVFEDWRNDSFRVSGGYVLDLYRKPLGLKESRRQVDLASVQNIRTEQKGLLSVLFRFGEVIIVTAGGASDTVFKNVSRPWVVQEALFRAREEGLRLQAEHQTEERKDDLIRFAEAMEQIRKS